jgi:hypothetical protein
MADFEDIRALSARYARGLDRFAMDELLEPSPASPTDAR